MHLSFGMSFATHFILGMVYGQGFTTLHWKLSIVQSLKCPWKSCWIRTGFSVPGWWSRTSTDFYWLGRLVISSSTNRAGSQPLLGWAAIRPIATWGGLARVQGRKLFPQDAARRRQPWQSIDEFAIDAMGLSDWTRNSWTRTLRWHPHR